MGQETAKIVAFVPARGGSKSIPLKNIRKFAGKPLVCWVLEAAENCELINRVYLSTDSEPVAETVRNFGGQKVEVISRSPETAADDSPTESAMLEFARNYDFDVVVLVQPTSPLLKAEYLREGIKNFFRGGYDSLLSVVRQKRFIWEETSPGVIEPVNYCLLKRPRRQEWPGFLVENGAFYITTRERLIQSRCRVSGKIGYYEMPAETYYELDDYSDWVIMESILIKINKNSIPDVS